MRGQVWGDPERSPVLGALGAPQHPPRLRGDSWGRAYCDGFGTPRGAPAERQLVGVEWTVWTSFAGTRGEFWLADELGRL